MPLFKGAVSPITFLVNDPQGFGRASLETLLAQLRTFQFQPVDKSKGRYNAVGWVDPQKPTGKYLDMPNITDCIILSARMDLTIISTTELRFEVKQRAAEECAARNLLRLPKKERMELEEDVRTELRKTTKPKRHILQMMWHVPTSRLFVSPCSAVVQPFLEDLLKETFEVEILPEHTYTECVRALGTDEGAGVSKSYEPQAFTEAFIPWVRGAIEGAEGEHMIGVGVDRFGLVFTDRVRMNHADGSSMDLKTRDAHRHDAADLMRERDYKTTLAKMILFCDKFAVDVVFDAPKWRMTGVKLPKPKEYPGTQDSHDVLERRMHLLADLYKARSGLFARFLREQFGLRSANAA